MQNSVESGCRSLDKPSITYLHQPLIRTLPVIIEHLPFSHSLHYGRRSLNCIKINYCNKSVQAAQDQQDFFLYSFPELLVTSKEKKSSLTEGCTPIVLSSYSLVNPSFIATANPPITSSA
jgi:hypothetical protein